MTELQLIEGRYLFECPHCQGYITVMPGDIACGIFRHAVFKTNLRPINPHASQVECDHLLKTNTIYGCAGPFEIINQCAQKCDYK